MESDYEMVGEGFLNNIWYLRSFREIMGTYTVQFLYSVRTNKCLIAAYLNE